ncbi:hypothetical protein AUK22_08745 [bacterium CG2_30_54_10]|nr:MAG: hypothetical protein AUK22_08745 [bacterium CG2_30_54_10]
MNVLLSKRTLYGFFFLGVLCFLNLISPTLAQAQGWGKVDTRILLILHPKLATFDYSVGRFYRETAFTSDREKLRKQMDDAWSKAQPALRSLLGKQSGLIRRRVELMQRWNETMNSLAEHSASETSKPQDYRKLGDQYKARYEQELAGLDQDLAHLDTDMQNTREEAYSPVFLRSSETISRLSEIKQEIQGLLAQAAGERGVVTVLDTSYGAPGVTQAPSLAAIPTQQDHFDLLSAALFHEITNWDDSKIPGGSIPMADGTKVDARSHIIPRLKAGAIDNLRQYLDYRSYLGRHLAAMPSPGGIFLVGGVDLTPVVARKLFDRYQIPEDLKNAFMQIMSEYESFEQIRIPDLNQNPGPPATR